MARTILHYGNEYLGTPAQVGVIPEGVIIADPTTNTIKMGDGVAVGGVTVNLQGNVAWADITDKPTTIAGFGITDAGLPEVIKAFAHVDVSTPITASASYNVTSVTSSATGKYDVAFTDALPNANYVVSLSVQTNVTSNHYTVCYYNRSTTGFQVQKFLNGVLDSGASGNFSFVIYQA